MRLCCTAGAACGYATGVGGSATTTLAGGVQGFPAALTSFIGRARRAGQDRSKPAVPARLAGAARRMLAPDRARASRRAASSAG